MTGKRDVIRYRRCRDWYRGEKKRVECIFLSVFRYFTYLQLVFILNFFYDKPLIHYHHYYSFMLAIILLNLSILFSTIFSLFHFISLFGTLRSFVEYLRFW